MNIVFLLFLQFSFRLCSFFSHFPFIPSLSLSVLQQQFSVALTIVQSTQLFFYHHHHHLILVYDSLNTRLQFLSVCDLSNFSVLRVSVFLCLFPPLDSLLFRFHVGFRNRFGGWKIMWTLHIFNLLNDLTFFSCFLLFCVSSTCAYSHAHTFIAIQPHAHLRGFTNFWRLQSSFLEDMKLSMDQPTNSTLSFMSTFIS